MMNIISFIRKLFKKENSKKEEKSLLLIKELDLENELNKVIAEKENKYKEILIDFSKTLEEKLLKFEKALQELKEENISLPDKQVEMLVNANKKEFLEKMFSLINEFKSKAELTDLASILSFYQKFYGRLREINALSLKDFLSIKRYFSSSRKVLENFKILFSFMEEFNKKFYSEDVQKILEIKRQVSDYLWLKEELEKTYNNLKEEKESVSKKEEELELKKKNLEELENSEEYKRLRELEREKAKINYSEKELSSICIEKAASIEHIIKRLRKRIDGKEEELLEKFISSPFDAVISFNVQELLESLIEKMKSLGFKEDDILKVESIVKDRIFEKISKEYFLLEEKLKEIESEIERISIIKEKRKIENEINSISFDLQEAKKSIEKLEKRIEELNFLKEKVSKELENSLSSFLDREVKIV